MAAQDFLSLVLTQLLSRSPMLLAELIGALVAVIAWRRSPRACLMLLLACIAMFGVSLVQALTWPVLLRLQMENGWAAERYALLLGIFNVTTNVLYAGCFLLLVFAVIAGRGTAPSPPRRPAARDDDERLPRRAEPPVDPTGIQGRS